MPQADRFVFVTSRTPLSRRSSLARRRCVADRRDGARSPPTARCRRHDGREPRRPSRQEGHDQADPEGARHQGRRRRWARRPAARSSASSGPRPQGRRRRRPGDARRARPGRSDDRPLAGLRPPVDADAATVLAKIAECESGGDIDRGLRQRPATAASTSSPRRPGSRWAAPATPPRPTRPRRTRCAAELYQQRGTAPWPACSAPPTRRVDRSAASAASPAPPACAGRARGCRRRRRWPAGPW